MKTLVPSFAVLMFVALATLPALAGPPQARFTAGPHTLTLEFPGDDLVHFEYTASAAASGSRIPSTPQVATADHDGARTLQRSGPGGGVLDTAVLTLAVDPATLCVAVTDKLRRAALTTLCPAELGGARKVLTLDPGAMQNVYGLGEQFVQPAGSADGDWTSPRRQVRHPGDEFGNQLVSFDNGMVGNAQFPVMYALGATSNYALFMDHLEALRWDFADERWRVEAPSEALRGYLIAGADLPQLRRRYMALTGRPPVPPRRLFGLWVSEYGFDRWEELEGRLAGLRADRFPVDGFVLDLQWFGGIPATGTRPSRMGTLSWDTTRFPLPRERIARLRERDGIALIAIEESYVDDSLPEHAELEHRGFLVRDGCATCAPAALAPTWWGRGGMIDWTLDAAADHWHDRKRVPLIADGIIGHWIDLGEPEGYDRRDWSAGVLPGRHAHADVHNGYNFAWARSIARGYARHGEQRRPFMLSRSGISGIQRFGTAMWSGDIAATPESLNSHFNVQMHMSLAGMDYFGADIGGFHRGREAPKALESTYTQWFANGLAFDVPVRPHTENLCNCRETAPNRIGDKASNLANLRQRIELTPYLYSLAHRAWQDGEAVVPPLVYHFQNDPQVRRMGGQKMLGRDLLVVASVDRNEPKTRDVYLPAGDWFDVHGRRWLHSRGEVFAAQPLYRDGLFRLPMYARAGAIIPAMYVDEQTLGVTGRRADGSVRDELIVRVFATKTASEFTLFEDDGETIAYQRGELRRTRLAQHLSEDGRLASVTVDAAQGGYADAPVQRDTVVELVTDGLHAEAVTLDGEPLARQASRAAFDASDSGWWSAGPGLALAKAGQKPVSRTKEFAFSLRPAAP